MATVALSGIITPSNVVTAASTTTLTNKTISGASNTLSNIPLSTGVTGTLPIANGGTGTTSTTFVNAATNVTGTLPVANGGTGAATLTANNVLLGNGTSALQVIAPSTSGNVLTSNGTTWASTAPSSGAIAYLSTTSTAGASSLAISLSAYTATYNAFKIVCTNFYGLTTTADFEVRINNSASGYISGGGGGRDTQGSGSFGWGARNTTQMMSSYSSTDTLASPSVTVFDLNFFNMNTSSEKFAVGTMVQALKTGSVGGNGVGGVLGGMWVNGATPTSINIVSSGTFVATVLLYGIKTS